MRGTADILPDAARTWEWMERRIRDLFRRFHYGEIRTPAFEPTDLFRRSIGEGTDIVNKEMYTFPDRKGRSITLRPEGTAGVVRALIQHRLLEPNVVSKYFYLGPMFRYERPQAGRQRQFHQAGIEIVGSNRPEADVEAVALLRAFFLELGLGEVRFRVNTTGGRAFRPELNRILKQRLAPVKEALCTDCRERFSRNVLRIYDCKVPRCRDEIARLPGIRDLLPESDRDHFESVLRGLERLGISFEIDDRLVRGLDYYTRTIFEAYSDSLGACDALAGGGRYDALFEEMGAGREVPAVGFAVGMERVLQALSGADKLPAFPGPDAFMIRAGAVDCFDVLETADRLRRLGFSVASDLLGKSVKGQFRLADRLGARFALIRGERETESGAYRIKDLQTGEEEQVSETGLAARLGEKLGKRRVSP
jgi:histidyl-tRNA synthetase